jgi:hypothetical protein
MSSKFPTGVGTKYKVPIQICIFGAKIYIKNGIREKRPKYFDYFNNFKPFSGANSNRIYIFAKFNNKAKK